MILQILLSLFLGMISQVSAAFVPHAWSLDQGMNGDNMIVHFSTVFEVPFAESPGMSFWPGLFTNPKDTDFEARLVQSLFENFAVNTL